MDKRVIIVFFSLIIFSNQVSAELDKYEFNSTLIINWDFYNFKPTNIDNNASGDIIVAGVVENALFVYNIVVIKYKSDFTVMYKYETDSLNYDGIIEMLIDNNDIILLVWKSIENLKQYALIVLDDNRIKYHHILPVNYNIDSMCFEQNEYLYLCGFREYESETTGLIIKYDNQLNLIWEKEYKIGNSCKLYAITEKLNFNEPGWSEISGQLYVGAYVSTEIGNSSFSNWAILLITNDGNYNTETNVMHIRFEDNIDFNWMEIKNINSIKTDWGQPGFMAFGNLAPYNICGDGVCFKNGTDPLLDYIYKFPRYNWYDNNGYESYLKMKYNKYLNQFVLLTKTFKEHCEIIDCRLIGVNQYGYDKWYGIISNPIYDFVPINTNKYLIINNIGMYKLEISENNIINNDKDRNITILKFTEHSLKINNIDSNIMKCFIYDIKGRLIQDVIFQQYNKELIVLLPKLLPDGMYFLILESLQTVLTHKMILLD